MNMTTSCAQPQLRQLFLTTKTVNVGSAWSWSTANRSPRQRKCSGRDTLATYTCHPQSPRQDFPAMVCPLVSKLSDLSTATIHASTSHTFLSGNFKGSAHQPDSSDPPWICLFYAISWNRRDQSTILGV